MTLDETIDFIQNQLDWRGPGGNKQGHIVLGRKEGELVVTWLRSYAFATEPDVSQAPITHTTEAQSTGTAKGKPPPPPPTTPGYLKISQ